jgi:PEP-CTERM motif
MTSDDLGASLVFSATFTGGQDVYYMRINAVPEPTSAGLVLFGGLVFAWRRRKETGREKGDDASTRPPVTGMV